MSETETSGTGAPTAPMGQRQKGAESPPPGARRWHSRGSPWQAAAALFALALLPRLWLAITWAHEPVWDGHFYDFGARRLAAGLGYSDDLLVGGALIPHPWCHYPVGYSALLAALYRLAGHSLFVAPVLNAALGALMAALIYGAARHATTEPRARLAGLLVALHPGLIAYTPVVMTELTAALGIAATAWIATRSGSPLRRSALAGIVLGLTTLVRPQTLLLAPALALFVPMRAGWRSWLRRSLPAALVASGVALAVVSPWTIRNCRVMDGCAFVSTNAGWNLAIGAFPRATGRFATLRASDGCRVITGQVQQDRCWLRAGMKWIHAEPGRWLGLVPRKLSETFDHESYAVGYLAEAAPGRWPPPLREQARGWLTAVHQLVLWLAALGVVAWPRGWRRGRWQLVSLGVVAVLGLIALHDVTHPAWPIALAIPLLALLHLPGAPRVDGAIGYSCWAVASVALTHAVFFGEDRYHMAITPLLCLLAACALRPSRATAAATGSSG